MKSYSTCILITLVILILAVCTPVWSSEVISESLARSVSGTITPFLIVGELSLYSNKQEFAQSVKALAVTGIATELLKHAVGEKRPNSDVRTSFPSGHTSAAFAMATILADYKPAYRLPAYALATAIGFSRVEAGSHYWRDVFAGALLGHFIAKHFTSDRIMVSPGGVGVQLKW